MPIAIAEMAIFIIGADILLLLFLVVINRFEIKYSGLNVVFIANIWIVERFKSLKFKSL
jgi:hypothetical protein